jgi:hypothetical protein
VLLHLPQDGGHSLRLFGKWLVEQRGNRTPALARCHRPPFEVFVQPQDKLRRVPEVRSECRHVRIETGGVLQWCAGLHHIHTHTIARRRWLVLDVIAMSVRGDAKHDVLWRVS